MTGRRLPGIGSHHSANPQTDEWLTPPDVTAALGPFDLDPCAPYQQPDWTGAAAWWTVDDDGLNRPWHGLVFVNPPYSDVAPWMRRLAEHGNGIALVFARCETAWWFDHVWPHTSGIRFLEGRLTFWRPPAGNAHHADLFSDQRHPAPTPSKTGHNSGGPSVLIAYGDLAARRVAEAALPGAWVPRVGWDVVGARTGSASRVEG